MAKTSINWTDKVWNPVRGCSKVSDGCRNCYAERMAARFCGNGMPYEGLIRDGHWANVARFVPEMLAAPLHWKQPCRVFVNSMSDLFHDDVTNEQIAAVFGVAAACPQHFFQILTKRPQRMPEWFRWIESHPHWSHPLQKALCCHPGPLPGLDADDEGTTLARVIGGRDWPLPNVHLGVSIENQKTAEERIPLLRECPAAVRWVSLEPMLGAVDLEWCLLKTSTLHMRVDIAGAIRNKAFYGYEEDGEPISPKAAEAELRRRLAAGEKYLATCKCPTFDPQTGCKPIENPRIDWVVCGGESGPNARPMHPDWVRTLRDQCREAGVPFHFKQWGEWRESADGPRCVTRDGRNLPNLEPNWRNGDGSVRIERVGKASAGNLLDGVRYEMRPGDKWQ